MTPEELTRLRELHETASPAPWEDSIDIIRDANGDTVIGDWDSPVKDMTDENLNMVIVARNALPALLAEIERLQNRERILAARLARVNEIAPVTYQLALSAGKGAGQ